MSGITLNNESTYDLGKCIQCGDKLYEVHTYGGHRTNHHWEHEDHCIDCGDSVNEVPDALHKGLCNSCGCGLYIKCGDGKRETNIHIDYPHFCINCGDEYEKKVNAAKLVAWIETDNDS